MRRSFPDPSQGVFETMLVVDGQPVELDAHLRRLAASLAAVYGLPLPAAAADLSLRRAAGLDHGRLRLRVEPGDRASTGGAECTASADPITCDDGFAFTTRAVALRSQLLPGGLGAHKWVDRSALPPPEAEPVPLLVDRGGEVLEAAWANLLAVLDGRLLTPPLDGRILPGTTRAATIDLARDAGIPVEERPLRLADLHAADEVFLTASVRGVVAARSIDGRPLGASGRLSHRLADLLRARWRVPRRSRPGHRLRRRRR